MSVEVESKPNSAEVVATVKLSDAWAYEADDVVIVQLNLETLLNIKIWGINCEETGRLHWRLYMISAWVGNQVSVDIPCTTWKSVCQITKLTSLDTKWENLEGLPGHQKALWLLQTYLSALFRVTTNLLLKIVNGAGTLHKVKKWDLLGEQLLSEGWRMVWSEVVGWIVVVEVGWHGTTLDDARPISSFLLYNRADYRWTISDCTAKVESWATNVPNATPVLTHRWYKLRALQLRRMRSSTLEKCVIILKIYYSFFLWTNQRVAYVYKAKKEIQGSKIRVIWGWVFFRYTHCRVIAHLFPN